MNLQRWLGAGALVFALVALPPGAYADHRHHDGDGYYSGVYGRPFQIGYDYGYRDGFSHGERDRRNGDSGYRHTYGSKDQYRQAYRSGYVAGYDVPMTAGAPGACMAREGLENQL